MSAASGIARIQVFAADTHSAVQWRLLSGNYRELARSIDDYVDRESCIVAVKQVQEAVREFVPQVRRTDRGQWTWQLLDGGAPVVRSAHTFDRQIRCEQGMRQFIDAIGAARISPATLVSQTRRWEQRTFRSPPPTIRRERTG